MARPKKSSAISSDARDIDSTLITRHQFAEKRAHLPPAGGDAVTKVVDEKKVVYAYDPHRTPVLRYQDGEFDLKKLLKKAANEPLSAEELAALETALTGTPHLEYAGRREQPKFAVSPVALHIHERISAAAILRALRHEGIQRNLFGAAETGTKDARAYYKHAVDWANRIIVGDSLQVMTSLAKREALAGKVQMVYIDPPYGIKFSSNWQNEVGKRDVKDKDEDLSREPEMIRAYRDTWNLGVHTYLQYIKQRLIAAKELLTDSGSVFVQISDENLHRVRAIMDEVMGAENFCRQITFKKTTGQASALPPSVHDHILWYARAVETVRVKLLLTEKSESDLDGYDWLDCGDGFIRRIKKSDTIDSISVCPRFMSASFMSSGSSEDGSKPYLFDGKEFKPSPGTHWKTNLGGRNRLAASGRLIGVGNTLAYRRFAKDYNAVGFTCVWNDTLQSTFATENLYVVQTNMKVIERCMLMTTEPGDLVLDPTCGSGTTAAVAEQWGRRWITIDTSRVAAAIARQRLLTASFPTYKVIRKADADKPEPPTDGQGEFGVDTFAPILISSGVHTFDYKTVPHITLKSIAQNKGLDPIFARHEGVLATKLAELNAALAQHASGETLRRKLVDKLLAKAADKDAGSVSDADERRWVLPGTPSAWFKSEPKKLSAKAAQDLRDFATARDAATGWREWEVPFDTDPDWPAPLAAALTAYRTAWRAKMDEVNAAIQANAEQEKLVDQPKSMNGVVRVSGPFTFESVRPAESAMTVETPEESPIAGVAEQLDGTFEATTDLRGESKNAVAHIDNMLELLRVDGVTFLGNKHVRFANLQRITSDFLHAEAEYTPEGAPEPRRVAVVIGPEHGSISQYQVDNAMGRALKRGYDDLVFAAFGFDGTAQESVDEINAEGRIRVLLAQIRPDVVMTDLLKPTGTKGNERTAQLFTVFGQPRTKLEPQLDDEYRVRMEGVDVYNPVTGGIEATGADKVAAWFVDTDYDGKVFCVCQAYFPDKSAWDKLARALKTAVPAEAFAALAGTTGLPFTPGPHRCVAVKVIDPRGNEVMRVHRLQA